MKKILTLLIILIAFNSLTAQIKECPSKNQENYNCGNIDENILDRIVNNNYVMPTKFNVKLVNTFKNQKDQEKALIIISLCNKVLNDSDFWNALQNYDKYRYSVFEENNIQREIYGIQIVNSLINGNPDDKSRPKIIDVPLEIKLYGLSFKTLFETAVAKEIGDGKIYNKRWFFKGSTIDEIGSNWIHEYSHSQGLEHCYYCNEDRDYSIPYVINRIFIEVAKKYIN